jgi:ribosomal protein S12 methylthiotransferase
LIVERLTKQDYCLSKVMKKINVYINSLGCAKNTVDSDSMASLLVQAGYHIVDKPSQAGVLIVNTCGFIESARQESYQALAELARRKKPGQMLIAAGCLTERYRQEVTQKVPGIDGLLGTRRWMDIVDVIGEMRSSPHLTTYYHLPDAPTIEKDERGVLRAAVQGGSAYLKIADGCRRPCAFCAIPLIKGTSISRPMETIVGEVKILEKMNVHEVNLIAQDTTDYGYDLGMKDGLSYLLEAIIAAARQISWIRILYAYPGYVTDHLIDLIASHPQIVPYLDIPLQHAHPAVLQRMRRPANMDWVYQTIAKMRSAIPDLALRTTFIVGYPGETEKEFQTLLDFITEVRFDHVGTFPYSVEQGTASEALGDTVPQVVKEERLNRLMDTQERISLQINQEYIGKEMDVLIEGQNQGISVGRSRRDAPEIDGLVIVEGKAPIGEIVTVLITGALTHDLTGILASTPQQGYESRR